MTPVDRRSSVRIEKLFRVLLSTDELGDQWCWGRDISARGMLVELPDPPALQTKVIVRFSLDPRHAYLCAIGRVRHLYRIQYMQAEELRAMSAIGLQFLRFVPELGARPAPHAVH